MKKNKVNRTRLIKIEFYVNEEEYERILKRAIKSHNLSQYLRSIALSGKVVIPVPSIDREALMELNRIGVNLNQVVKKINESDAKILVPAIRLSLLNAIEPLIDLLFDKVHFLNDKILGE